MPCISLGDDTLLEENMIFSNEPGLYNPTGGFGYNHSNTVLVTRERGVYLNCGSAVVLPEVFLKAVALARNRGITLAELTTVNLGPLVERHDRLARTLVGRSGTPG